MKSAITLTVGCARHCQTSSLTVPICKNVIENDCAKTAKKFMVNA